MKKLPASELDICLNHCTEMKHQEMKCFFYRKAPGCAGLHAAATELESPDGLTNSEYGPPN